MNHSLVAHLESHLGLIGNGWGTKTDSAERGFQIVDFPQNKIPDVTVLSTLGLSNHELHSGTSGKNIRQELFVMLDDINLLGRCAGILDQIGKERIRTRHAVLRGETISKPGLVFPDYPFVAMYATNPVYYPKSLWSFDDQQRGGIALC